jgi:hypothetical protein
LAIDADQLLPAVLADTVIADISSLPFNSPQLRSGLIEDTP